VVHISSNASTTTPSNCPQLNSGQPKNDVCDLTLLGISGSEVTSTIRDDLTNPTTPNIVTDPTVGMYVVGEQVSSAGTFLGYSRFTTSRSVPTWLVGSNDPSGDSCTTGSLYSKTSGAYALWGCKGGTWIDIN
jgi:hypothetical protein